MKYILTKYDYAELFPIMTPAEIKGEFKERSRSVRSIYNTLEKITPKTAKKERDTLINKFLDERSIDTSAEQTQRYIEEALEEAKVCLVGEIWERIYRFEERFG